MTDGHSNQDATPRSALLRRLLAEGDEGSRFASTFYSSPETNAEPRPYELLPALGLTSDDLSDNAKAALEAIEEVFAEEGDDSNWVDFQWHLSAFLHVQEMFEVVLQPCQDQRVLFQQYYFYFESRLCLAESVLAGLNGLYLAAKALLRPFLEFTLLQNYYHRIIWGSGTYQPLEDYFVKGRHPGWGRVLKKSLPDDSFCRPIRSRIQTNLRGLSESSSHPHHPDLSPTQSRHSFVGHSLEGLFFWQTTLLVLDSALWAYYVNYPLLFHPVGMFRKFGYGGPVGMFADPYTAALVKRSLPDKDYRAFVDYSMRQEAQLSSLEWVNGLPDMSDNEIRATWNPDDGELDDLWRCYCLKMAKMRALRMAMAFRPAKETDLPDTLRADVGSLEGWQRIARLRGRDRH